MIHTNTLALPMEDELLASIQRLLHDEQMPRRHNLAFDAVTRALRRRMECVLFCSDGLALAHCGSGSGADTFTAETTHALWAVREQLVHESRLDPDLPPAMLPVLVNQIFFELECGDAVTRAACERVVQCFNEQPRWASFWQPRYYSVVVECAKSPSVNHALAACPTAHVAPLFAMLEAAARRLESAGTLGVKDLVGRSPNAAHLASFLRHGPVSYAFVTRVLFPVLADHSANTPSARSKINADVTAALSAACAAHADVVHPFLAHALEAAARAAVANGCTADEVWPLVGTFQQLLAPGGCAEAMQHPCMSALVTAAGQIAGAQLQRKSWLSQLAREALAVGHAPLEGTCMSTLAAVVGVDASSALEMVAQGLLTREFRAAPVESAAALALVNAVVAAYAALRAVPDLVDALSSVPSAAVAVAGRMTVRDMWCAEGVRGAMRDALRGCLPAVAGSLAMVPHDMVTAVLACDVLRWGPALGADAAVTWVSRVWQSFVFPHLESPIALRVYAEALDCAHYRWSPLVTARVVPAVAADYLAPLQQQHAPGKQPSKKRSKAHPWWQRDACDELTRCMVQRLRLVRDFPHLWSVDEAEQQALCGALLARNPTLSDWPVLLWAGGLDAFREWLLRSPQDELAASYSALDAAWCLSERARACVLAQVVQSADEQRARAVAALVPLDMWALCGHRSRDAEAAMAALLRVGCDVVIAQLVSSPQLRWRKAALAVAPSLGPQAVAALQDDSVWQSVLALPRPRVWAYAALATASEGLLSASLQLLVAAGAQAWQHEQGCWAAWTAVLERLAEARLATLWPARVADELFNVAWRCSQWTVLEALHRALHALCGADAAAVAARVSLRLLAWDRVPVTAVPGLMAAAVGQREDLYRWALFDVAVHEPSCRALWALLENPLSFHHVPVLREALAVLLANGTLQRCADGALAARCIERSIRLAPPYNATQLSARLQLAMPRDSPACVRASMAAVGTARRICPSFWLQCVGTVSAMVSRALHLVSRAPEGVEEAALRELVSAARAVGREIGAGGADLKKRKHYLAFVLSEWLSRHENHAPLEVRRAVWGEGMVVAMEAACMSDKDQRESYGLVRGGQGPRQEWKRYRKMYQALDAFKGKI